MSEADKTGELVDRVVRTAVARGHAEGLAAGVRLERERVTRLFDKHLAGRVIDDDLSRALDAFARDLRSGKEAGQ